MHEGPALMGTDNFTSQGRREYQAALFYSLAVPERGGGHEFLEPVLQPQNGLLLFVLQFTRSTMTLFTIRARSRIMKKRVYGPSRSHQTTTGLPIIVTRELTAVKLILSLSMKLELQERLVWQWSNCLQTILWQWWRGCWRYTWCAWAATQDSVSSPSILTHWKLSDCKNKEYLDYPGN